MKKILIAGESWMSYTTHVKGFDSFTTSVYEEGVGPLKSALDDGGFDVEFIPNHLAPENFPFTRKELDEYACVVLSDIGSNTLLLSDRVFAQGSREANRLDLIREYVTDGGAFLMIGGYMSFSGIDGKTRYGQTAIADVLPVSLLSHDDRVECPQGIHPDILEKNHPVFTGISDDWPFFLGYNRTIAKTGDNTVLAGINGDPFVAVGSCGKGRTAAFTSDCAPHWGPVEFTNWSGYNRFWTNLMNWLTHS